MKTHAKILFAGAGALAIAGTAIAGDRAHVMNVALPDGSVAQVHYVGDVAPRIMVAPAQPLFPIALGGGAPFAMLDRIAAQMDAQIGLMLRQASSLATAQPTATARISQAALGALPPGTVSYSMTSYASGNGASCSQSVQVTSLGAGQPPKVVRQNAGDCSALASRAAVPAVAAPASTPAPILTPVSLQKVKPSTAQAQGRSI